MNNYYKLYGLIDKKYADNLVFMGTMEELCEYTGLSSNTIRSYMSHCKKEKRYCPYILIGNIREETEEERKERKRAYQREYQKKKMFESAMKKYKGE